MARSPIAQRVCASVVDQRADMRDGRDLSGYGGTCSRPRGACLHGGKTCGSVVSRSRAGAGRERGGADVGGRPVHAAATKRQQRGRRSPGRRATHFCQNSRPLSLSLCASAAPARATSEWNRLAGASADVVRGTTLAACWLGDDNPPQRVCPRARVRDFKNA